VCQFPYCIASPTVGTLERTSEFAACRLQCRRKYKMRGCGCGFVLDPIRPIRNAAHSFLSITFLRTMGLSSSKVTPISKELRIDIHAHHSLSPHQYPSVTEPPLCPLYVLFWKMLHVTGPTYKLSGFALPLGHCVARYNMMSKKNE
jgi:hypothetical protein